MSHQHENYTISLNGRALALLIISVVSGVGGSTFISTVATQRSLSSDIERRMQLLETRFDVLEQRGYASQERLTRIEAKLDYLLSVQHGTGKPNVRKEE